MNGFEFEFPTRFRKFSLMLKKRGSEHANANILVGDTVHVCFRHLSPSKATTMLTICREEEMSQ